MALVELLLRRWARRGGVADRDAADTRETPRLPRPAPTSGTMELRMPHGTPSTDRRLTPRGTAGTPNYRVPSATPSTQRIHNPLHPGR